MYVKKMGEKTELAARHRSQLIGLTFEDIGRFSETFAHADRRLWPDVMAAITVAHRVDRSPVAALFITRLAQPPAATAAGSVQPQVAVRER